MDLKLSPLLSLFRNNGRKKSRFISPVKAYHEEDTNQKDVTATGINSDSPQSKSKLSENTSISTSPSSRNLSSASSVSSKRKTSSQTAGSTDVSGNILASDNPLLPKPSDQCQHVLPELINIKPSSDITVALDCSASESLPRQRVSTGQTSGEDILVTNPEDSFCDLLEKYESYRTICLPLHIAAIKGDVNDAKWFLKGGTSVLGMAITKQCQTVFHLATGAKQFKFVKEMVKLLGGDEDFLEQGDINGNNAFCYAAAAGTIPIAKVLLKKKPSLLRKRGFGGNTPLKIAALFGQRHMALFLTDKLKNSEEEDRKDLFFLYIHNGWYDLASKLLDNGLALARDEDGMTALHLLAKTPSAFTSESAGQRLLEILKKLLTHRSNSSTQARQLLEQLWDKILCQEYSRDEGFVSKHNEALFDAARLGNFNFLKELIRSYPCLVYQFDEKSRSIFHIAIMHRHIATFNLIHDLGFDKQFIAEKLDEDGNSLLHLAATYLSEGRAASTVPGAALEMQQELILFKEVELLVMPKYKELKNIHGYTPRRLFTEQHAKLLESGEKWMKQAAKSCSLVATIIATGVFAAAFSPTGGDGNTNGTSVNPTKVTAFQIFSMADAVALASSSISILMFLSILTSRYEEKDFRQSLPLKLVVGIATLFISMVAMMLAFSSSFFLTFGQDRFRGRFPVTISMLASLSVIVFVMLQYGLFSDILYSSFRFRFSIKPRRASLFGKKEVEEGLRHSASAVPQSDGGPTRNRA